ncbi:MAG: family 10 glycosylhydrolase [Desulfobacterales bacterium]|nr:family 10 glycosylhydrolase [Desulfobacterales bacterium]
MKKWAVRLILILFVSSYALPGEAQEKIENPGELYDSSVGLYYKGRCEEATKGFSKIIQSFPESKLISYSIYMIGLCHFKMERYEEALKQFKFYLKTYPEGDRAKEAERRIPISKAKLEETTPPQTTPSEKVERKTEEVKSAPEVKEVKKVRRRICAQVFYLDVQNIEEVEKKVKELKRIGVDTLILRVFQNKGDRMYKFVTPRHEEGVYFKTEYAPVVEDILGPLTEIAHRYGLEVFAWMATRYANYGLEGNPEYRCKSYNFETRKVEETKGFNLFHPDVLKRLEGLFRDLGRYPIEGILFQDDLILKHNEDFNTDANKAFLKEFGYAPHPDRFYVDPYKSESGKYYVKAYSEDFWSWANWKNRWLMNVAQQLMAAARESNPNLQFAINLYYEAVLNHTNGVAWFSQTLSKALEKDFDYYVVMAYHRQAMKEKNLGVEKAIDLMAEVTQKAVKLVGDPSKVLMKFQIYDWKSYEVVAQKEVGKILAGILNQGKVSLAFYPYLDQFPLHLLKGKWTSSK